MDPIVVEQCISLPTAETFVRWFAIEAERRKPVQISNPLRMYREHYDQLFEFVFTLGKKAFRTTVQERPEDDTDQITLLYDDDSGAQQRIDFVPVDSEKENRPHHAMAMQAAV